MAPSRGDTQKPSSNRAWNALTPALSDWILTAVAALGLERMTPVQASTIPLFMGHKDVVVEAVTGSGKTLSFLIPVVERLLRIDEPIPKHHVGAIIISPTRELASQIHSVLLSLLNFHGPSAAAIQRLVPTETDELTPTDGLESYPKGTLKVVPQLLLGGSTTAAQDLSTFLQASPNILIGTPGRLLEILSSPYVHCPQSSFEVLVLDEADRLLDLGFKEDLTKLLNRLPKQRRTGLFSASVSEAVDQIIRVGLRNPVRIAVRVKSATGALDKRTPASLQMTYLVTPPSHKWPQLASLLASITPTPLRTIVYLSTCAAVDYYQSLLPSILPSGMTLIPLHGKHPSNVRQKNFMKFTNSASPALLLTTDVAARGLDIPSVDLVVQIDPPSDPKAFLHRCGRAGRAGRRGLSVIFLTPGREEDYVSFLEVRKTPIEPFHNVASIADNEAENTRQIFVKLVLADRALHDKAQRAFVSWVRSYSKHQASSIFRVADIDWVGQARSWALLKLPKMPELKSFDRSTFDAPVVDWDGYAYKDKQREKVRRDELRAKVAGTEASEGAGAGAVDDKAKKRPASTSWSANAARKETREVKRSKRAARREHERKEKMGDEEKEFEEQTNRMIEKVRQKQLEQSEETFNGFD
ncbi:hypothetical protein DV738_g1670, partial [Chaetothyriales sp. CBS 135597]